MKALEQDDFQTGMFIVGMGRPARDTPIYAGDFGMTVVGTMKREDNSYRGCLYRVEAVDLPFISIRQLGTAYGTVIKPGSWDGGVKVHDLREGFRWGVPTPELVSASWPEVK